MPSPVIGRLCDDEQREALIEAHANPSLTGRQVAAMAAAGELIGPHRRPLAPFEVSVSTVRSIARRHRELLRPDDLEAANQRLIRDLLGVANFGLRAIKAKPAGKRGMRKLAQIVTVHARIGQVLRDAEEARPAPTTRAPPSPSDAMGPLMLPMRRDQDGHEAA